MKTDFASWVIIWVNLAYRGPTLYFACLCQHFRLSHIFSHVAPLHLQWTKGLSLSPSRFLASQPQGTRSSLHPPFLASFFCKIAHCFAFRPPLFYSCAWLIVWGRRTGWGWGTMHHQFRPIDPHAPSLCPSQLVLQENRKTAWGSGLAVALTHTPTTFGQPADLHTEDLKSVWMFRGRLLLYWAVAWNTTACFHLSLNFCAVQYQTVNRT